jgi:hypothetical protein
LSVKAKVIIAVVSACALFGAGYFVAMRISGGSVDLQQRYGEVVSNLGEARDAQREITFRLAGMSNELEVRAVAIGNLKSRNGELIETVSRLQGINRAIGESQSNLSGGIGRAIDSATESGELIGEFGILARRLQAEGRGGD